MSAGASQVCMITGIAETTAITMMVTASSLAIASRLCPLFTRAINSDQPSNACATWRRCCVPSTEKQQSNTIAYKSFRLSETNYFYTGSAQRAPETKLVRLGFENKIDAFRFAARDGDILRLRSIRFMPGSDGVFTGRQIGQCERSIFSRRNGIVRILH